MPHRDLNVLDAADRAADMVNALIDRSPRGWLLHVRQMRDSVQSIGANISEGFGRGTGRARDRSLEIARGEAEETIRHLAANIRACRIHARYLSRKRTALGRWDADDHSQRPVTTGRRLHGGPLL